MKRVDQIPFNIDETKCYEIAGKNMSDILNKLRDGRGNETLDLNGQAINLSDTVIFEVVFLVQI